MIESVAVVTGASSGIGRATALRLARDFSGIALVAREAEKLHQVAAQIEAGGCKALPLELDLGKPTAAQAAIERTLAAFGRIDALLNIAGARSSRSEITAQRLIDRLLWIWDNGLPVLRGDSS